MADPEMYSVPLPRGHPAPVSPRLVGQLIRKGKCKTYNVQVEPGARDVPKDFGGGKFPPADATYALDERGAFREERLRRFQMGSHFPALASPHVVPSWSDVVEEGSSGEEEAHGIPSPTPRTRGKNSVTRSTTVSISRKQRAKLPENLAPPWHAGGVAGLQTLISDRPPSLYQEQYVDGDQSKLRDSSCDSLGPAKLSEFSSSAAGSSKVTFDSGEAYLHAHISAMRERGRAYNDRLKERYKSDRENFQRERDHTIARQGALSTFEWSYEKSKQTVPAAATSPRKGRNSVRKTAQAHF